MEKTVLEKLKGMEQWNAPEIPEEISYGDMPGDKIDIGEGHIRKAQVLFPVLAEKMIPVIEQNASARAVICVCGGSGVGKSEIASLLSYYFTQAGIGSYILSGDNYPHRIPKYNDAERLHLFREAALKNMVKKDSLTMDRFMQIRQWQTAGVDADSHYAERYPWFADYLEGGREGLRDYLGTTKEIAFEEVEEIVRRFKDGEKEIWLKRMGRSEEALWYEKKDFSKINVLIIEWTHGNSDYYHGVDIPILLNSTPQETLEHRRSRNRDGATDSPFTMLVLELEQQMLHSQAHKAQIILSKTGELLDYEQYCALMKG